MSNRNYDGVFIQVKKIAITGHSKGLGKILFDNYTEKGFNVFGASRSNGFNLEKDEHLHRFCKEIIDYDVLINNAPGSFQAKVFTHMHKLWYEQKKVIMNIGSRTTQFPVSKAMQYGAEKSALDFLTRSTQHFGPEYPAVLLIRPGYFAGVRSYNKDAPKMNPDHVAELVMFMIENSFRYKILDLVVTK